MQEVRELFFLNLRNETSLRGRDGRRVLWGHFLNLKGKDSTRVSLDTDPNKVKAKKDLKKRILLSSKTSQLARKYHFLLGKYLQFVPEPFDPVFVHFSTAKEFFQGLEDFQSLAHIMLKDKTEMNVRTRRKNGMYKKVEPVGTNENEKKKTKLKKKKKKKKKTKEKQEKKQRKKEEEEEKMQEKILDKARKEKYLHTQGIKGSFRLNILNRLLGLPNNYLREHMFCSWGLTLAVATAIAHGKDPLHAAAAWNFSVGRWANQAITGLTKYLPNIIHYMIDKIRDENPGASPDEVIAMFKQIAVEQ